MARHERIEGDDGDGGTMSQEKFNVWELTKMAYIFPGNICPSGNTDIPVTMSLPDNIPQSINYNDGNI